MTLPMLDRTPEPATIPVPTPTQASGHPALTVLAVLASIVALWWGRRFMVPLTAGLMLALLVLPLTALLTRWLRVRLLATTLSLLLVLAALAGAAAAFGDQLARVAGRAPDMISLVAQKISTTDPGVDSVLQRARRAFVELDVAAERLGGTQPITRAARNRAAAKRVDAAASAAAASASAVSIVQTATEALRDGAVSGSGVLLKLVIDVTVVFFIAFFVLSGGQPLAERILDLWAVRPGLRARAEHAALECVRQIRLYAAVLLVTNTMIGLAVWGTFALAGLPDAAGWGVTAAVLHIVPYLGMALLTGLGAAETFLAHGSLASALAMGAFVVLLSTVIGTLVLSWLQGRAARMNAATVFIGVVFWGTLWGIWGLLLGPALTVLTKVLADHTHSGRRLADLMQG